MVYCDLNIALVNESGNQIPDAELERIVNELVRLNYTRVCLNTCVKGKSLPTNLSPLIPDVVRKQSDRIKIFTRVTLEIDDVNQNIGISSNPLLQQFDVIAVCPRTEKAMQLACSTLEVDIISLDLGGGRMEFPLRGKIVGEAVQRGVHFEICYGGAIRDAGHRRNLFGNSVSLLRATGSKNLVVASGAKEAMELRAPKDVLNVGFLFGLNGDGPHNSLTVNPMRVLERAANRKFTCKSTISTNQLQGKTQSNTLHDDFIKLE